MARFLQRHSSTVSTDPENKTTSDSTAVDKAQTAKEEKAAARAKALEDRKKANEEKRKKALEDRDGCQKS